jgi:large subunit ribosomal protein L15e
MVKSGYELIRNTLQEHNTAYNSEYWKRLIELRKGPTTIRIERPINLPRARAVGYKAKQGYVICVTKVRRGTRRKSRINETRKNGNLGIRKITAKKSLQWIAEERVAKKYTNLQVLNSYQIATDGLSHYFEIILVDPKHPSILADPKINWIAAKNNKSRALRGLTSAGKKTRGLRNKGLGAEKVRPSLRANGNLR